jgi:hypothetical protein
MLAMSLSAHDPKPDIDDHSIASSGRASLLANLHLQIVRFGRRQRFLSGHIEGTVLALFRLSRACVKLRARIGAIPDPFETMSLQTVPGGAESPESVRQRSNLAELLA